MFETYKPTSRPAKPVARRTQPTQMARSTFTAARTRPKSRLRRKTGFGTFFNTGTVT
jgi:hypothetical protein